MSNHWKHEVLPLSGTPSEIAKVLDDRSNDDWELVSIFTSDKVVPIKDFAPSGIFAVLRRTIS